MLFKSFPFNNYLMAFLIVLAAVSFLTFKAEAQTATDNKIVDLINSERQKANLSRLNFSAKLYNVAKVHNQLMHECSNTYGTSTCFSHQVTKLGEAGLMDRVKASGYSPTSVGEIIARGQKTPESAVSGWMGSSGHRANILTTSRVDVGCHHLKGGSNSRMWWTCTFGKSSVSQRTSQTTPNPTSKPTIKPSVKPSPTVRSTPRVSVTSKPTSISISTRLNTYNKSWWCNFFSNARSCRD
jgi:uncharacterized protein YkwD